MDACIQSKQEIVPQPTPARAKEIIMEDRNYYVDLNGTIGYIPNQAKDAPRRSWGSVEELSARFPEHAEALRTFKVWRVIRGIEEEARSWTEHYGGLTLAANDLLCLCATAHGKVKAGDKAGMIRWVDDPFQADTGPESDLLSACLEWAEGR